MIADYDGTILIVSHDRDFIDRTVTSILAFEGDGKVQIHAGGYSEYLEKQYIIQKENRKKNKNQMLNLKINKNKINI